MGLWRRLQGACRYSKGAFAVGFIIVASSACGPPVADENPFAVGSGIPTGISEAVGEAWSTGECVTARTASQILRARLLEIGQADWTVTMEPGVKPDGCVAPTIDATRTQIRLNQALRPEVRVALERVADELLETCLGREDAARLVSVTLNGLGETDWELRSDGPIGGPIDRLDEIELHVEAGCFIYSGTGLTPEGRRQYFIGGR